MITIYKRGTDIVRAIVDPDQFSEQRKRVMGEDIISLNFSVPVYIDLQIGDHASVFGEQYFINTLPEVQKVANRNWSYSVVLESKMYDLGKVQYLFLDPDNNFTESEFSLAGRPEDFLKLIVFNMKRVYPTIDWKPGFCVEAEYKTLTFASENCLEVLSRLASEFSTEYLVEGTTINLFRKQSSSGISLQYGFGLHAISRRNKDNSNVITRLYAFGSNKNIGSSYRDGATQLRLPTIERYVEKNINRYGIVEETMVFEDIFPSRQGTLTSVDTPFIFSDSSMDFDVNDYLMPGVSAKINFNTGALSGYTFEISDYDHPTKTFTILKNTEEQTLDVPSIAFSPVIGDKYVLIDMLMPPTYIKAAENKLKNAAIAALNEMAAPKLSYVISCDAKWFKRNAIELRLAQTIAIKAEEWDLDRQIRNVGYNRNLRQPSQYTVELSDVVQENIMVKLVKII